MTTDIRTVLVTGAAGGIGSAVARALAADGIDVALLDRDGAALSSLVTELVTAGHRAVGCRADVTVTDEVESAVQLAETELGPLDGLVNAAGVLHAGPVVKLTDHDWNRVFAVNTAGLFHVSRAVARRMATRGRGSIVTVTSNAAHVPRSGMAVYAASKAAAGMFTKCLGLELAAHGIRCNCVEPGSTDTPMLTALWPDGDAVRGSVVGAPDTYRLGIPLGRVADPADIADAVLFLLSDRSRHITLHDLTVDGGAGLGA